MSEPMNGLDLIVALRQGVKLSRRCGKPVSIIRYADGELRAVEDPLDGDHVIITGIDAPPTAGITSAQLSGLVELTDAASRLGRAVQMLAPGDGLTVSDLMGEMLLRAEAIDMSIERENSILSQRAKPKASLWKGVLSIFS